MAHQPCALAVVHVAFAGYRPRSGWCARCRRAFIVHGQRAPSAVAVAPSSNTVTPGAATRSPIRPREGADVPLRLKSPSRPCPTASCSSNAVPARAQTRRPFLRPGRRRRRGPPEPGAAPRPLGRPPLVGRDPGRQSPARPPAPGTGHFAPPVLFDRHRDIESRQGADVTQQASVGAQDLDHTPLTGERGGHLHYPRVGGAGVGVDLLQQRHFVREAPARPEESSSP